MKQMNNAEALEHSPKSHERLRSPRNSSSPMQSPASKTHKSVKRKKTAMQVSVIGIVASVANMPLLYTGHCREKRFLTIQKIASIINTR